MKNIVRFIISAFLIFLTVSSFASERTLHVIPAPKQISWRDGSFRFDRDTYIRVMDASDETQKIAAEQIRTEATRDFKIDMRISNAADRRGNKKAIVLGIPNVSHAAMRIAAGHGIAAADLMIPEGYVISVGENSVIVAGTDPDGLYWGVQTLKQIMRADSSGAEIPKLRIDDWPVFHFRGVEEDVSRGPVPTMATVKTNIERLSELKINKFMFYMENVFCYKKHPDIPPKGACFTAADIRELDVFAGKRHVGFVGAQQSFGHLKKILDLPAYNSLVEQKERPEVLSPANEGTYRLIEDLYSEIVPSYKSDLFNMECDETGGLGEGQSSGMAAEIGVEGVYAYHINKLYEMLKRYGKRPMMWADIVLEKPAIIPMLPRDIIMLPWEYHAQTSYSKRLKPLADAKLDFIASIGVTNWSRIFPDIDTAILNARQFALDGARFNAMGVLNSSYNDDGENFFGYNWFPLAFGAEASWNPYTADADSFRGGFGASFFGEKGGNVDRAMKLIGDAFTNMEMEYLFDISYMSWPPKIVLLKRKVALFEAKRARADMDKAVKLIDQARGDSSYNAENLDYISFAAWRARSVAAHKIAYIGCLDLFDSIKRRPEDRESALKSFDTMDKILSTVVEDTKNTLIEYRRLWLAENRPYYLNVIEGKYKDFTEKIEKSRAGIAIAKDSYIKTGVLPKNIEEMGL